MPVESSQHGADGDGPKGQNVGPLFVPRDREIKIHPGSYLATLK